MNELQEGMLALISDIEELRLTDVEDLMSSIARIVGQANDVLIEINNREDWEAPQ
tara:strand:- start:3413 stop:3577 length:165 start_codon:yes stop_codon:yes gene_type:complete